MEKYGTDAQNQAQVKNTSATGCPACARPDDVDRACHRIASTKQHPISMGTKKSTLHGVCGACRAEKWSNQAQVKVTFHSLTASLTALSSVSLNE